MVILKDGVRYNLWTPKHEVNDFEPMIIHHVKDIFGPGCEYFPKQKLKTLANNRSIPDGFVVDFDNKKWYIVELKLLCDDAIRRITGQIVDYKNALKNQKTVRNIYKSIKSIKDANFLDDLINDEKPKIVVLINSLEGELGRQFNEKVEGIESGAKIIEFKTFYREGADPKKVHIHMFLPLYKTRIPTPVPEPKSPKIGGRWNEEENLKRANEEVKEMYWILDNKIRSLNNSLTKQIGDHYTNYKYKETITSVNIRKNLLTAILKVGDMKVDDPRNMCEDIPSHWGYGNLTKIIKIQSKKDIPYALSLIKQALKYVKNKQK